MCSLSWNGGTVCVPYHGMRAQYVILSWNGDTVCYHYHGMGTQYGYSYHGMGTQNVILILYSFN